MGKIGRRILIGLGVFLAILVVAAFAIRQLFDVNDYKPQIAAAVEKSTGLQLAINGKASLDIFPRVQVSLKDVHLSNRGADVFAASEVRVAPRVYPFIRHREVIVDKVSLMSPKLRIEKDAQGRMNYETAKTEEAKVPQPREEAQKKLQIQTVSIKDGSLDYLDRKTGKKAQITGMNLNLSDIARNAGADQNQGSANPVTAVSFKGKFAAQSIRSDLVAASDVKAGIRDDRGLIHLDSTEAKVYGGVVRGNAQVDLRGKSPQIRIAQTASHLDLKAALPKRKNQVAGFVDASVDLSTAGASAPSLTKAANGKASVRGDNITLSGVNVDELATQLKSTKGMGLVDIGTSLVTGPLAPALGQAAGITSRDPNAKTVIRHLVSDWEIKNGVADAKDVAIATEKNTIAFKGKVNLVNKSYQDFFVANVDPNGCSKNKVEIVGNLNRPRPNVQSLGTQIAQPYVSDAKSKLESEARNKIGELLGAKREPAAEPKRQPAAEAPPQQCDHFYSGAMTQKTGEG